jgi:hypothetical protein
MFHNNRKVIPKTYKNKQGGQKLSDYSQMKKMRGHSFMTEIKNNHILGIDEG